MNGLWEIINGWEHNIQVLFLSGILVAAVLIIALVLKTIRVILRGYPPDAPPSPKIHDCNHDDNLTGICLKPSGCKTVDECNAAIAKHNAEE